ncbi:MAG: serine/threonine-protein kinase [Chloroflexota bacterium]
MTDDDNAETDEQPGTTPERVSGEPLVLTIGGRYEVDLGRPLSSGGMHSVFPARDLKTRAVVIARTLRSPWRDDPAERVRFRREARLQAFIRHPNLARTEAFIEEPDGFWMVQEHLEGGSLADRLALGGPMAPEDLAPVLEQAAEALAELHRQGVVHLALTPGKLLFDVDGRGLKLLDLGLAVKIGEVADGGDRQPGATPYRSPEHRAGDEVGPESDLYSLGCIAFEALTGITPADATDGAGANGATFADGIPQASSIVDGLPEWTDGVLNGALAEDPAGRDPDVRIFAQRYRDGVEGVLAGRPLEVPAPRQETARPGPRAGGQWVAESPQPAAVAAAPGAETGRERVERLEGERRPFAGLARTLWTAAAVLLAVNLLAAGILLARDGAVPPFRRAPQANGPAGSFLPGDSAVVNGSGLQARTAAGADAPVAAELVPGEIVTVAGAAVAAGGERWLPVTITRQGAPADVWVNEGWLRPRG